MRPVAPPSALSAPDIERALERLRQLTRARGLRHSAQREDVARVALRRDGHFSVDELLADLRRSPDSDAHPATVYRVLPLLVEAGLLQLTLVSQGEGRCYERAFERDHHDHLICTRCGDVIEFHYEAIELLQRDLAERFGFQLTGHVHELHGLCAACQPGASAS